MNAIKKRIVKLRRAAVAAGVIGLGAAAYMTHAHTAAFAAGAVMWAAGNGLVMLADWRLQRYRKMLREGKKELWTKTENTGCDSRQRVMRIPHARTARGSTTRG